MDVSDEGSSVLDPNVGDILNSVHENIHLLLDIDLTYQNKIKHFDLIWSLLHRVDFDTVQIVLESVDFFIDTVFQVHNNNNIYLIF